MKTRFFISVLMMVLSLSVNANDDIPLSEGGVPFPGGGNNPRSVYEVSASVSNHIVTVSFESLIDSRVVVTESQTGITLFDQSYDPAYSVLANLTSLPAGNYTLYIYAYGIWWYGTFEIE